MKTKRTVAAAAVALTAVVMIGVLGCSRPAGYDAIAPGMTPQQVRALLGEEPTPGGSTDPGEEQELYFLPEEKSRGYVVVYYVNGRVVAKQFVPPPSLTERLREWMDNLLAPGR